MTRAELRGHLPDCQFYSNAVKSFRNNTQLATSIQLTIPYNEEMPVPPPPECVQSYFIFPYEILFTPHLITQSELNDLVCKVWSNHRYVTTRLKLNNNLHQNKRRLFLSSSHMLSRFGFLGVLRALQYGIIADREAILFRRGYYCGNECVVFYGIELNV